MTDAFQPIAKRRRRFRFSLRTLLVVVTLAAVGSWGIGLAWPWWQANRQQVQFETAVQKLQRSDVDTSVLPKNQNDMMQSTVRVSTLDKVGKFIQTNASYCIVFKDRHVPSWPHACESISVYRLPHAPHDYKPYHERDLSEFDHPATSWVKRNKVRRRFCRFYSGRCAGRSAIPIRTDLLRPAGKARGEIGANVTEPIKRRRWFRFSLWH